MNNGIYNGNRILHENTVKKIFEIQNESSGVCYLWWHIAGDWYIHSGGMRGGASYVELQYNDKIAIIIFTNTEPDPGNSIAFGGSIHKLIRKKAEEFR